MTALLGPCHSKSSICAGKKEQLIQLNESNHVEGHLAELDVKAYQTYCETQRDRFRYLEAPWFVASVLM